MEWRRRRCFGKDPWAFDKNLVILSYVSNREDLLLVPLNMCDFNVHVSGLPFGFQNHRVAEYIGNALGSFVDFDEEMNRLAGGNFFAHSGGN